MSEKTGCEIAYHRALITALRSRRDELQIQYQGLHNYYYTMNKSKWFNENSYEARRLNSHMSMLLEDIDALKEEIKAEQNFLRNYMKDKAEFYKKIRHNRKADSK